MTSDTERCKGVLIIEDDEGIRDALRLALEFEGFQVITAENGIEGLSILRNGPRPCLILLDFMMPLMNGQEFAEELRIDDVLATIPVVVVSAYGDKANMIQSSGFIKKPIDLDRLMVFVNQYCKPIMKAS